jgi:hypothetical protein
MLIIVARRAMSETSMKNHFSNTMSTEFYNVYVKDSTLQILNSSTMFKLQGIRKTSRYSSHLFGHSSFGVGQKNLVLSLLQMQ